MSFFLNKKMMEADTYFFQIWVFHSTEFPSWGNDFLILTFPVEDHAGAWSSQSFVCGGGDDVAVLKRTRHHTGRNQTTNMCHVSQDVGIGGVGNLAEAGIV